MDLSVCLLTFVSYNGVDQWMLLLMNGLLDVNFCNNKTKMINNNLDNGNVAVCLLIFGQISV